MSKVYVFICYEDNDIYAYTENKKYAEAFRKTRDMDMFDERTYHDSVLKTFSKKCPEKRLISYTLSSYDYQKKTPISEKIIMTKEERAYVQKIQNLEDLGSALYPSRWIEPCIFKDKYYNVLDRSGYVDLYEELWSSIYYSDAVIFNSLKPNELNIFLYYFGYTINLKG